MLHVRVKDLQIVFSAIARQQPAQSPDIRPVSPAKLQANALSASVQTLLTAGMTKSDAVGRLFHQWHDPTYGDSIAEAFRRKYEELRNSGLLPDLIFAELQAFAGGVPRGAPKHEAAVLAVLAFLFEECDIFESSRDGTT